MNIDLPTSSGVYIFKNFRSEIIYIGKAKNLRIRVRSYFQPPIRLGPKTQKLVSEIASIEHIEVGSEIEALLLESSLIKKFKPQYNIALKDDKLPYFIHISNDNFPIPVVNHEKLGSLAGPFLNSFLPKSILRQFRRVTPYCLGKNLKKPCFYSHMGLCNPCPGNPNTNRFDYLKSIAKLIKLVKGQFKSVKYQLQKEMLQASKEQNYELARVFRDKLKNLDYLLTRPVSPEDYWANPNLISDKRQEALEALKEFGSSLHRIEMYDIANLSGTAATGAMTVAIDGEVNPKYYRHFTIKTKNTPDDVSMMKEMLTRRLKRTDWPKPDLIVLDGGKTQLSIISPLLSPLNLRGETPQGGVIYLALAKRDEIIYTQDGREIKLPKNNPGLQLLQRLRDEAHRFSRRLHHKHRKIV